jgi:adenosine kinase
MADAGELSLRVVRDCGIAIISPNDPGAMVQYAEECRALGIRYIFDPGQQCARMSGDELTAGAVGATIVVCNDYEFELLRQKSGLGEDDILVRSEALIVTRGEHGSSIITRQGQTDVPAVATRRVVDPTGVGDAFRGGLMKGIAMGLPYPVCAQIGSVAATYALEHLGGQSHAYSWDEFRQRYEEHFGSLHVSSLKSQI